MNEKLKKYLICLALDLAVTMVLVLLALLILNNLGRLVGLFNDNRYVKVFFGKLYECEMKLPVMIIVIFFLMYLIPLILYKKNKLGFVIITMIFMTLVGLVSIILLTTFDGNFFFQIIENLKESLNAYK